MRKHENLKPWRIAIAGIILLLVALSIGVCIYLGKQNDSQVEVTIAVRGEIAQTLDLDGDIVSNKKRTYYAGISAIVHDCDHEVGDDVKKGDMLATYDTYDLDFALEKAQLSNDMAELDVADAEGFNGRKSDRYELAQSMMDERIVWMNKRQEDLDVYREELIDEQNSDSPNPKTVMRLQNEIQDAANDIQVIRQQLTTATQERDAAEMALISNEQKEKLSLADELADSTVDDIKRDIDIAREGVVCEFDGVVTETYAKSGAAAVKGQPLLTVSSAEDACVKVEVGQKDFSNIMIGQRAVITSVSHKYDGVVERIGHAALTDDKDKQVVPIYVHIDNPDEYIIIDMEAKVTIDLGSVSDAVIIPSETLHEDNNESYCYVLKDGIIRKQYVTTGLSSGDNTEITEGLNEGDMVLWFLPDSMDEGDVAKGIVTAG